jgi:hypothetical protein
MQTLNLPAIRACRPAWNKGRIVGQKRPLLPKHVWATRSGTGCRETAVQWKEMVVSDL